jgi:DNA-directed RNA polymerase subunit RPC12/RpoP
MCQRARFTYVKRHFACFHCRKSFKQSYRGELKSGESDRPFRCPECGVPMKNMGADFKAPRQCDSKQWLKVEILESFGIVYQMGCCDGPGDRPAVLREVEEFLVARGLPRAAVRLRIKAVTQSRKREKVRQRASGARAR